ncbi:MAG: ATP phosphoribosyltransferase regulatory subunit [Chloroflexi bacterium]|nr:ATP phosphoribosyltransferase regulatory subunit [Chloroflexota bacterium]
MLSVLNQHMQLYGYELLELPVIDRADLFLIKAGDQIINHMLTFDRQNEQLALRPEFTASATHYFVANNSANVARWQFAGPVFEDNLNEYEQLAIGAELIGLSGSYADAEVIAMSALGLETLGVPNWRVSIGHVGLIRELLQQFNLDLRTQRYLLHNLTALQDTTRGKQWLLNHFDKQDFKTGESLPTRISYSDQTATMGGRTYDDIIKRMDLKKQRAADRDNLLAAIDFMEDWCQLSGEPHQTFAALMKKIPSSNQAAISLANSWEEAVRLLGVQGIAASKISVNPGLIRTWEYYTGFVFDLYVDNVHVGGGGRYDELGRLIGSIEDVPAVGFTYYGKRLLNTLSPSYFESHERLILRFDDNDAVSSVRWATQIRSHGQGVELLPSTQKLPANAKFATLQNDQMVSYSGKTFNFDQIQQFLTEINRSVHSDG